MTSSNVDTTGQPIAYFDSTYQPTDSTNKYANLPADINGTTLYHTDSFPAQTDNFTAYYATMIDNTQPAGIYSTTITYTVIGEPVPPPPIYAKVVEGASFQDTTLKQSESCSALTVYDGTNPEAIITMTDNRNNQPYQVAKLADNKCWMLNNLKLGSTAGPTTLTSSDTNLKVASWTLPQVNEGGLPSTGYIYDQPKVDALLSTDSQAGAYSATKPNSQESDNTSANFAGYYYNWCAATAGIPTASDDTPGYTCTNSSTEPDDAQQDICPSGWRLPTGGFNGNEGFYNLYNAYNGDYTNFLFSGPFKGVFSGHRYGSTWNNQGSYGYFWSGSHRPDNSYFAFFLRFDAGSVDITLFDDRDFRFAVRCLVGS